MRKPDSCLVFHRYPLTVVGGVPCRDLCPRIKQPRQNQFRCNPVEIHALGPDQRPDPSHSTTPRGETLAFLTPGTTPTPTKTRIAAAATGRCTKARAGTGSHFTLDNSYANRKVFVEFEGRACGCQVYCNGNIYSRKQRL